MKSFEILMKTHDFPMIFAGFSQGSPAALALRCQEQHLGAVHGEPQSPEPRLRSDVYDRSLAVPPGPHEGRRSRGARALHQRREVPDGEERRERVSRDLQRIFDVFHGFSWIFEDSREFERCFEGVLKVFFICSRLFTLVFNYVFIGLHDGYGVYEP